MKKKGIELTVGVFVLIGILSLSWLSFKLGKKELLGGGYYSVYADFESISGLRKNGEIEIAGVVIGRINGVALADGMARVEMKIRDGIELPEDTIVSVKSRGLIGDKIISISLGGSAELIPPGGVIIETESAVDFEALLSQFIFGDV